MYPEEWFGKHCTRFSSLTSPTQPQATFQSIQEASPPKKPNAIPTRGDGHRAKGNDSSSNAELSQKA